MSDQAGSDTLANDKVNEIEKLLSNLDKQEHSNQRLIDSWFTILKQIITAADLHRTNYDNSQNEAGIDKTKNETGDCIYADYVDDNEQFNATDLIEQFATHPVKWTIRVRAFKLVHRLVKMLSIKYLPDLIRLSFVSATSPYDDLKMQGFEMFRHVINRFAHIEEDEFPGHSILEQYRTQVITAIKPAFDLEAPPYITAIASNVGCTWICRGLERESNGLKRAYLLILSSLNKLENQSINQNIKLYTESELEQERLGILGSWAQLYIRAKENLVHSEVSDPISQLLDDLMKPQVNSLVDKWWDALKDYALLILTESNSTKRSITLSESDLTSKSLCDQQIYTSKVALSLFSDVWHKLTLAVTLWLCCEIHDDKDNRQSQKASYNNSYNRVCDNETTKQQQKYWKSTSRDEYFKFICGIIMKELCDHVQVSSQPESGQGEVISESTIMAIRSMTLMLKDKRIRTIMLNDPRLTQEFYSALYTLMISHRSLETFNMSNRKCLDILSYINLDMILLHDNHTIKTIILEICTSMNNNLLKLETTMTSQTPNSHLTNQSDDSMPTNKEQYQISVNLLIRISNLSYMLPRIDQNVIDDIVRDEIVKTFRAIISFQGKSTTRNILLNSIKEILNFHNDELKYLQFIILQLYDTKIFILRQQLCDDKKSALPKKSDIGELIESIKADIRFVDQPTSLSILSKLLSCIEIKFQSLVNAYYSEPTKSLSSFKDDIDYYYNHFETLKEEFKELFETTIDKDGQLNKSNDTILNIIREYHESIKPSQSSQAKTSNSSVTKPITKKRSKIVLKTDFANFYANK